MSPHARSGLDPGWLPGRDRRSRAAALADVPVQGRADHGGRRGRGQEGPARAGPHPRRLRRGGGRAGAADRELRGRAPGSSRPRTAPAAAVVATNEVAKRSRPGRAFAIVLDDLGLELGDVVETRRARGHVPRAIRAGRGRGDAGHDERRRLVERAHPRGARRPARGGGAAARAHLERVDRLATTCRSTRPSGSRTGAISPRRPSDRARDQAMDGQQDLLRARSRLLGPREVTGAGLERSGRQRMRATLATVRRALLSLGPVRGRKSLLLFSRGFIEDATRSAAWSRPRARPTRRCSSSTPGPDVACGHRPRRRRRERPT